MGLELGRLTSAAAAGTGAHAAGADATGAHAAGAQATRCDGIAGAAGCTHSCVHRQVPTAGGAAGTTCHRPGTGHAEVAADNSTPGAADTCQPQSLSQNSEGKLSYPRTMPLPEYLYLTTPGPPVLQLWSFCSLTPTSPAAMTALPSLVRSQ